MPATVGYAIRAGFAREATVTAATWPAASAAVVTQLLPLLDYAANDGVEKAGTRTTTSGIGPVAFDLMNIAPSLQIPLQLRYQGLEQLWACALGFGAKRFGATLNPETLATGAYKHRYELDSVVGATPWMLGEGFQVGTELQLGQRRIRRGTFAADLQSEVWECLSCMVAGWTLAGSHAGCTLTVDLAGYSKSVSSVVNTATTLANASPNVWPRARFDQLAWRIAPYSSSTALSGTDVVPITSWALRVDHNLATSFGPRLGTAPEEYERTQASAVTLTFVLPRHEAETWQSRWRSNARLMADAKWTGPAIGATGQNYQCNVYLPSLQVTNAQLSAAGSGLYPDTVQAIGVIPSTAAAGFPAMQFLGPLAVELVSGVSVHGLGV
jgi:hypothetical protein